jgi:ribosomal subunit interface protein
MQTPLQVTFRSMAHSDALEAHVQQRVRKLDHFCDRIISCHVVIEVDGHRHRHGAQYRVSVHLGLPGHEISVHHSPPPQAPTAETAYATCDHALDDAERQVDEWTRRQRDHVAERRH